MVIQIIKLKITLIHNKYKKLKIKMNSAQIADEIFRIFALKKNQDLSNETKKNLVEKIVVDIYNKGRRSGHNKAVEMCKNALKGLENANNAEY